MSEAMAQPAPMRLSDVVGGGYNGFWNTKKFYRIVKGAKGSKKSKTMALWLIVHMMKYPNANALVVRKVYATLRQSCYTDLLWAIDRLGVGRFWKDTTVPLMLEYIPTGQQIIFRGMDDAQKLASIMVRRGYLCWVWIEEAYELTNEDEFKKLEFSIRGRIPPETGLWKQITLTFNPWSEHTWIKSRFFDDPDNDTFLLTTTYKCNEWLGEDDIRRYEELYIRDPRNAKVICDGDWGVAEGLIYTNWYEQEFDIDIIRNSRDVRISFGLDFGYAVSYNAFVAVATDLEHRTMWIFDEMYEKGLTNLDIAKRITEMGYSKEVIWADAAEPKSIYELQQGFVEAVDENDPSKGLCRWALPNIRPALKGPDSLMNGISHNQEFRVFVHPRCVNVIRELSCYCWEQDRDGKYTGRPIKDFDHCLVAGTMVLTDHGEVPIEDIRVGDMVLTHLGYRKVLASGITRPEPAEIWRMTCEDGTIVEGTADHPFPTNHGVLHMSRLRGSYVVRQGVETPEAIKRNSVVYNGLESPQNAILNFKRRDRARDAWFHDVMLGSIEGFGLMKVTSVENTGRKEMVYDLTVDEAHTFFANGMLVSNCMDAWRYSQAPFFMRGYSQAPFFMRGRGLVAEAKGYDSIGHPEMVKEHKKSRRVFST